MKIMKLGLVALSLFNVFGCSSLKVVNYTGLCSYVEVSLEKEGFLIARASLYPDSFHVITHYKFYKSSDNKYLLTLYFESGDRPKVPEIKYIRKWGGIEVTIPRGSFNPEKDVIYYKDNEGEYKLNFGTYETWQEYLKRRWPKLYDKG